MKDHEDRIFRLERIVAALLEVAKCDLSSRYGKNNAIQGAIRAYEALP